MELTSLTFLLALFVLFVLHWLSPRSLRSAVLLAGSYLLYAYWDLRYLWVLLGSTAFDFSMALLIGRIASPALRKSFLFASICANLGILVFFKYAGLLFGLNLGIFIPLGVSFYTFHSISYVVDVYRRKLPPCRSILDYALFVGFFPKLIAGPIERAESFLAQLQEDRRLGLEDIFEAARLILYGLFLKLCVADRLAFVTDKSFSQTAQSGSLDLWLAFYAYSLQIYADFFGYTLIARGSARLFGIHLNENFLAPYFSASPREFWRRWHISLSSWFRDYVYFPLGGNRKRVWLNILITMGLAGLWHGANLKFLFWGIYHGLCLCLERALLGERKISGLPQRLLGMFTTFHIVSFGWIFFRAQDFASALSFVRRMFAFLPAAPGNAWPLIAWVGMLLSAWLACALLFLVGGAFPILRMRQRRHIELPFRGAALGIMLFMVLLLGVTNAEPFVYFYF